MSLFKTKEWWRTECGANERFDKHSLLVAPLFGAGSKDIIIVCSHDGYIRMYNPSAEWVEETSVSTGYKSTDLIIETKLTDCIIDVKAGKFVSGSQDLHLAVLTPNKLNVYTATLRKGSMEHGDRCDLEVAYGHALSIFPASLTSGPFGGVRGRDFLCVQCLDGSLHFYEQETFAFIQILQNRLLPEPIVYISKNDSFVTSSSAWMLECYRYQSMAESNKSGHTATLEDNAAGKGLEPDWSYNVGEAILDIETVILSSFEIGIMVLGERNLYCLKDNHASLKCAKKLEYRALCFCPYVIEPDGKLMVLVVADTSTLMIYEGTTLKWSAQLPFQPIGVARARFQHLDGAIVILSDEGHLEACYLGSEPSLFIAPPLNRRGFDYVAAEEELFQIRQALRKDRTFGDRLTEAITETELLVSVTIPPDLEPSVHAAKEGSGEHRDRRQNMCRATVELSSYTTLYNVQIYIDVPKPLVATQSFTTISNLRDRHYLETVIYPNSDLTAMSSEMKITITYETNGGHVRVTQKSAQLPLKMFLKMCQPENTSIFTATIKCNEPLIALNQLFPEFVGDQLQKQNWNALGLQQLYSGHVVTIVSGATSNRYRIQSNDGVSVTFVIWQLINRLKDKTNAVLTTSIGQTHIHLIHTQMDGHFRYRQEVNEIMAEIDLLTNQLRNIEKRMLRATRERNCRSLVDTGLPFLLNSTHQAIFKLLDDLATARAECERASHDLQCALKLVLLLLNLSTNDNKYPIIEAAIGFDPQLCGNMMWEEVADVTLLTFLKSCSKKGGNLDAKAVTWNKVTSAKDLSKLKKRLSHAIERLDACGNADIVENETVEDGIPVPV